MIIIKNLQFNQISGIKLYIRSWYAVKQIKETKPNIGGNYLINYLQMNKILALNRP